MNGDGNKNMNMNMNMESRNMERRIQELSVENIVSLFYHDPRPWAGAGDPERIAGLTGSTAAEINKHAGNARRPFNQHVSEGAFIAVWARAHGRNGLDLALRRLVVEMLRSGRMTYRPRGPGGPGSSPVLGLSGSFPREVFDRILLEEYGAAPGPGDTWGVRTLRKLHEQAAPEDCSTVGITAPGPPGPGLANRAGTGAG